MTGLFLALVAGSGVCLLLSSAQEGAKGVSPTQTKRQRVEDWLAQAGLAEVEPTTFIAAMVALLLGAAVVTYVLFGGPLPAAVAGFGAAASLPASYRARRRRRQADALEAWPRLIDEIRISTGSLGKSVPQALLDAAESAPREMHPAFAAASREWRISTDFGRAVRELQRQLADPTADATCETLLVAHAVGGNDLDSRLSALAEDRRIDVQGRKDAAAKQAGVRFARRFVIVVPIGMALAGMSIGTGRAAYQTPLGQIAVATGLITIAGCWMWAGYFMRLPEERRVFRGSRL
ncbi:MAG: type II secretion system F family protein [Acidimicrobiales bacterium]